MAPTPFKPTKEHILKNSLKDRQCSKLTPFIYSILKSCIIIVFVVLFIFIIFKLFHVCFFYTVWHRQSSLQETNFWNGENKHSTTFCHTKHAGRHCFMLQFWWACFVVVLHGTEHRTGVAILSIWFFTSGSSLGLYFFPLVTIFFLLLVYKIDIETCIETINLRFTARLILYMWHPDPHLAHFQHQKLHIS